MPELPEVETTRRGIAPHCEGQKILKVRVYEHRLRWPVPDDLARQTEGCHIRQVERRAKYLLLHLDNDRTIIVHLGMSGSLRIITDASPPGRHDHIDLQLQSGAHLRFNDPRRFGCWLCTETPARHPLLAHLGPEPLSPEFNGDYLRAQAQGRTTPVKSFIMDSRVVVGVGNIYANEALYQAGIHPRRAAGRISLDRYRHLAEAIRETLSAAILMGGTTLRDFVDSDGKPGYFAQSLQVYGRAGAACTRCQRPLREIRISGRSSVYCPVCQR